MYIRSHGLDRSTEEMDETRRELRSIYRKARKMLSAAEYEKASALVIRRIASMPEYQAASTVLIYSVMPGEVDISTLPDEAASAGKRFVYPLCLNESKMVAMLPGGWRRGMYGITEPDPDISTEIAPENIELVICPGVAFDDRLTRLGSGCGYYDRYLPGCVNAKVIMAAFEAQHADELPKSDTDYPMEHIVTELKVY